MKNTIYALLAVGMMTACSSDDMPLTQSDEAKIMTFNVTMGDVVTRASSGYHDWNENDPSSMSVFGYADEDEIFTKQEITYSESKWNYTPLRYWINYINKDAFKFVACMPSNASVAYDKTENKLTMDVSVDDGILTDTKQLPLVSKDVVKPGFGTAVNFQMDQTLTGFNIKFQLGEKMGALRYFNIKSVKLSGNVPVSGTVTRDYTKRTIEWSNIATGSKDISINNAVLKVDDKDEYVWGSNFFVIPNASFNPTITVTYDVCTTDGVVTRKDVESTIQFNSTFFSNYTSPAGIGKINTILIKIVPDYLYVLADSDQTVGYLVIE